MAFHLRSRRFQGRAVEADPVADDDDDAGSERNAGGSSDSSSSEFEAEFESMTAKGIKRLCSELLEMKKATDEDFQRNVYASHSSFVSVFKEVGLVESEILELRRHVSTQKKLVQTLLDNLHFDFLREDSTNVLSEEIENIELVSPWAHRNYILEKVDVLLSEHQFDEALNVLETETANLQKSQAEDGLSTHMLAYASSLSDKRLNLADQFILVAEHPRVSANELQKALSGLCRLSEDGQANLLLLKYYRRRLESCVHELQSSKQILHGTYITELAKIVFRVISLAARSFVQLYGEASSYTSELIQWAREETEAFGFSFNKHIKSISETNGGLTSAVVAAKAVVCYCGFLKNQRIILLPELIKCIRPCMEEVLSKHVDHLKKIISIFTATDVWVISRYLISGIFKDKPFEGIDWNMEYCVLTSSGRKFVTLVQAFVEDTASLVGFQIESLILHRFIELFEEYICVLRRAIPNGRSTPENEFLRISSAQKLPQRLALLVNSSSVMQFLQCLGHHLFKLIMVSNDGLSPEHSKHALIKEFNKRVVSAQEAVDKLRSFFCQNFVQEIMLDKECERTEWWGLHLDLLCSASSQNDFVPSFPLQVFFLQLRYLQEFSRAISDGQGNILEKVPNELLEAVINWLSNNPSFWKEVKDFSEVQHYNPSKQYHLDLQFLMEIARIGGQFSGDLIFRVKGLMTQSVSEYTEYEMHTNSDIVDYEWASKSAKVAIDKLQVFEISELLSRDPDEQSGDAILSDLGDDAGSFQDASDALDFRPVNPFEENIQLFEIESANQSSLKESTFSATSYDGERSEKFMANEGLLQTKFSLASDSVSFEPLDVVNESDAMPESEIPDALEELALDESSLSMLDTRWHNKSRESDEEGIIFAVPEVQSVSNLELVALTASNFEDNATSPVSLDVLELEDLEAMDVIRSGNASTGISNELVFYSPATENPTDWTRKIEDESDWVLPTVSETQGVGAGERVGQPSIVNFKERNDTASSAAMFELSDVSDTDNLPMEKSIQGRRGGIGTGKLNRLGYNEESDDEEFAAPSSSVVQGDTDAESMYEEDEGEPDEIETPRIFPEEEMVGSLEFNYGASGSQGRRANPTRFSLMQRRFMQTKVQEMHEGDSDMEAESEIEETALDLPAYQTGKANPSGAPDAQALECLTDKWDLNGTNVIDRISAADKIDDDDYDSPARRINLDEGHALQESSEISPTDASPTVPEEPPMAGQPREDGKASGREQAPVKDGRFAEVGLETINRTSSNMASSPDSNSKGAPPTARFGSDELSWRGRRQRPKFLGDSSQASPQVSGVDSKDSTPTRRRLL